MSHKCKKYTTCINQDIGKIAVIDTCVVFNIMSAIIYLLKDTNIYDDKRFERFCHFLVDYLYKMGLCSSNEILNTTENIFFNEMNPLNSTSPIYDRSDIIDLCEEHESSYLNIHKLLNQYIKINDKISNNEIKDIKKYLRKSNKLYQYPSDNDLSLIAFGLKKGQKKGGIIITDDNNLSTSLDIIKNKRLIELNSKKYDTTKLISYTSLGYLSNLYKCCELYYVEFWYLLKHIENFVKKIKKNSILDEIKQEKQVDQAYQTMAWVVKEYR